MSRWRPSQSASLGVALAALLLFAPRAVQACAVCFGGQEGDTRTAFILTTAFLTFSPLVMIGATVWWLRRRFRQLELEENGAAAHERSLASRGTDGAHPSEIG